MTEIKWYHKPYFDFDVGDPSSVEDVVGWLRGNNIRILNVAGNSEQTAPGIGDIVFDFMCKVLKEANK